MKRQRKRTRNREAGFSLVELVAVMIIMGLLATTVTLGVTKMIDRARNRATASAISTLSAAISTFHLECGSYPSSLQDLIAAPSSGKVCKNYPPGGFLEKKEIPNDPWDMPYNYTMPGIHNTDSYDLWSNGMDKEDATSDDITNWAVEKGNEP